MRLLYSVGLYLLLPFILLRLVWRARKAPAYAQRWAERFGYFTAPKQRTDIWIHAVSLGEVNAALPLIKKILQDYPDLHITVTTLTPTGSQRVQTTLADQVFHVYLPYDWPDAVARFLKNIQPRMGVLMETELWPNLITACHRRNIPLVLANARLSPRSTQGYARIKSITADMLNKLQCIVAQAPADAERFKQLGASPNKIKVCGNIKFDSDIPKDTQEQAKKLRMLWGENRPVWIAASTHAGEDEIILDAFSLLRQTFPKSVLILVPRHPERFDTVNKLCHEVGFHTVLRTEQAFASEKMDIFLGNTLGELLLFYAAADVAFVGGSLVPIGGHNPLEPASLTKPIISGKQTFNFTQINHFLMESQALITVSNASELTKAVAKLFSDEQLSEQMGQAGLQVVKANRGSIDCHISIIRDWYFSTNSD